MFKKISFFQEKSDFEAVFSGFLEEKSILEAHTPIFESGWLGKIICGRTSEIAPFILTKIDFFTLHKLFTYFSKLIYTNFTKFI